jgi:hypothetical protein
VTDEPDKLQEILEWATAIPAADGDQALPPTPDPGGDPNAVALRDAWITFGRLLEAADAAPPESLLQLSSHSRSGTPCLTMVGRSPETGTCLVPSGRECLTYRNRPGRRRWIAAAAGATALAAIVAGAIWFWKTPAAGTGGPAPRTGPVASGSIERSAPVRKPRPAATSSSETQWDDAIDQEIVSFDWQVFSMYQERSAPTRSFELAQYAVAEMQQGLAGDSL